MQMIPYVGEEVGNIYNGLTPAQKAVVAKYTAEKVGELAYAGYKGIKNVVSSKKRKKKKTNGNKEDLALAIRDKAPSISRPPAQMAATAMSTTMRQSYSKMLKAYTVVHREYISEVFGSVDYNAFSIPINPGNGDSFPWLSRIALNFEQYCFKSLIYSLKTQSPTSTTGSVILAVDYDPSDTVPVSKAELLQFEGATRSAPWNDCVFDCKPQSMARLPKYYVAAGQATTQADLRLQNMGSLIVATQGQANTSVVSELWVEYEVDLITPQSLSRCLNQLISVDVPFTAVLTDSNILSNKTSLGNILVRNQNNIDPGFSVVTSGVYRLMWKISIANPSVIDDGFTSLTINGVNYNTDEGPFIFTPAGATFSLLVFYITVRLFSGDVILPVWNNPSGLTYSYLFSIMQVEPTVFAINAP